MSKLNKKILRDIKLNKMQFFNIFIMVFLGVFVFAGIHSYMDGMRVSGNKYYENNNLQDIWLTGENFSAEDLNNVKKINNVRNAQRVLSIQTDLENYKDVALETNFIESNEISKMYIVDGEEFSKEKSGLWLDSYLAKNLNLKVGDEISWHVFGDDNWYTCKIVGLNRDPQNQNLNMTKKYYESLGLTYKADSLYTNDNLSDIKILDGVDTIQNISSLQEGMENMLETVKSMIVLLIAVSAILGFVIIYNLGVLSFAEKQYQFATLKVLGFKNKQIQKIFVKQNLWLSTLGIILGLPLGFIMTDYIFKSALGDSYDFSASIKITSYLLSIFGSFVVSIIVNKVLARKIKTIDMVTSLKGNE